MASRLCSSKLLHSFCKVLQTAGFHSGSPQQGGAWVTAVTHCPDGRFIGFHCGGRLSSVSSGAGRSALYWL